MNSCAFEGVAGGHHDFVFVFFHDVIRMPGGLSKAVLSGRTGQVELHLHDHGLDWHGGETSFPSRSRNGEWRWLLPFVGEIRVHRNDGGIGQHILGGGFGGFDLGFGGFRGQFAGDPFREVGLFQQLPHQVQHRLGLYGRGSGVRKLPDESESDGFG